MHALEVDMNYDELAKRNEVILVPAKSHYHNMVFISSMIGHYSIENRKSVQISVCNFFSSIYPVSESTVKVKNTLYN